MKKRISYRAVFAAIVGTTLLLVSGCTTMPSPESLARIDYIRFSTSPGGPFCGRCDSTTITAAYDGRVWIEQGHQAEDTGSHVVRRQVHVAPESISSFRERLAPHRPQGDLYLDNVPPCKEYVADKSSIVVEWHDAKGDARLVYDFGCEIDGTISRDLRSAPLLLGIPASDLPFQQLGATAAIFAR